MLHVYHLSSPVLFCGRTSPGQLRPGRTFQKGRILCGRFRPSLFRKGESRAAGFVRWSKRDPPDRADRNDELLGITVRGIDRERQEAVARLAGEGLQGEPLTVP